MGKEDQHDICTCSLSQPIFLGAIIFLWAITSFRYVRENAHFSRNVFMMDTDTDNMTPSEVFEKDEEGCKLARITLGVKFFVLAFIQLPKLIMDVILLWIGCRWLVATLGFGEILLNALALEFILNLHEILYFTIV